MTREFPTRAETAALRRACRLAALGAGTVLPNPVVGCVILDRTGQPIGEGFHHRAGGPHAEIEALAAVTTADGANGATAVVTLEPCNHSGRTGPCSEALIRAGIARVVIGVRDPWLPAAGGVEHLRSAGVDVVLAGGTTKDQAHDVNRVWLDAIGRQWPFVTLKAGMTLDGRVAAADGTSRWITSTQSRADVHRLRAQVDTIMVGVGTVLADDPALTVRDARGRLAGRQPLRVVLDSRVRTPAGARVRDGSGQTLIADAVAYPAPDGRVDVAAVLAQLYRRGQRHVLLEGGPTLAASMLDAGLVDEALFYVAPLLLGAGRVVLADGAVSTLAGAHRGELKNVARFGPDLRLRYAVVRSAEGSRARS